MLLTETRQNFSTLFFNTLQPCRRLKSGIKTMLEDLFLYWEHEAQEAHEAYEAEIDEAIDRFDSFNPQASEEEREEAISRIIDKIDKKFLNA